MAESQEVIWIIGASSGIGAALARELTRNDGVKLVLSARRREALDALNQELGGRHVVCALDVGKQSDIENAVATVLEATGRIDRVVYLAAIYQPGAITDMTPEDAEALVRVNLLGAMYVVHAMLPVFASQQSGQFILCGSVAGYSGLPNGQPYSATKAAIINFAESLHAEAPDYLDVKVINPGFVRTPMTDKNDFTMPMRIEPEEAAASIVKGMKKRAFEIHFPRRFTYLMKCIAALPYVLKLPLLKQLR